MGIVVIPWEYYGNSHRNPVGMGIEIPFPRQPWCLPLALIQGFTECPDSIQTRPLVTKTSQQIYFTTQHGCAGLTIDPYSISSN